MEQTDINEVKSFYNGVANTTWEHGLTNHYHVGLFQNRNDSFEEAQNRTVNRMAEMIKLNKEDIILDIGCGSGYSALQIARNYKCSIVGINISEKQLSIGDKLVSEGNMKEYIKLIKADAHQLPFKKGVFTGAYALESLMHMNRRKVLDQVFKVLKPGSKFVLCDWVIKKKLTESEEQIINKFTVGKYVTLDTYKNLLELSGFRDIQVNDWTNLVKPTYEYWTTVTEEMVQQIPEDLLTEIRRASDILTEIAINKLGYVQICARR